MKTKTLLPIMLAMFLFGLTAEAHEFNDSDRCSTCNMMIKKFPGPKGLVLMQDGSIHKFCSTREAYCFVRNEAQRSLVKKFWVHDAGKTDWKTPDDRMLIDGNQAWIVYGTRKRAVMGPAVATFSDKADAEKFIQENGGVLYENTIVTTEFLDCRR